MSKRFSASRFTNAGNAAIPSETVLLILAQQIVPPVKQTKHPAPFLEGVREDDVRDMAACLRLIHARGFAVVPANPSPTSKE